MATVQVDVELDDFDTRDILHEAVYILTTKRGGGDKLRKELQCAINDITGGKGIKERNLLDAMKMETCEKNLDRRTLDEIESFFNGGK